MAIREYKFRAWDKVLQGFSGNSQDLEYENMHHVFGFYCSTEIDGSHYLYSQYTGLNDINGVEIYEDDIVEVRCGNCIDPSMYVYKNVYRGGSGAWCINILNGPVDLIDYVELCKVSGNIYKNKDLLEVK